MRIATIFTGSLNTCYTSALQNAHMKTSQLSMLSFQMRPRKLMKIVRHIKAIQKVYFLCYCLQLYVFYYYRNTDNIDTPQKESVYGVIQYDRTSASDASCLSRDILKDTTKQTIGEKQKSFVYTGNDLRQTGWKLVSRIERSSELLNSEVVTIRGSRPGLGQHRHTVTLSLGCRHYHFAVIKMDL